MSQDSLPRTDDPAGAFLAWLVRLDDPAHAEERRRVSLPVVIGLARKAQEQQASAKPAPQPPVLRLVDTPKAVKEALVVAQTAVGPASVLRPYQQVLMRLTAECDRLRPLGPDGRHGDLHTPWCGCDSPVPGVPGYVASTGDAVVVTTGGPWFAAEVVAVRRPSGDDSTTDYRVKFRGSGLEQEISGRGVVPTRESGLTFDAFAGMIDRHRTAHPEHRPGQSAYHLLFLTADELARDLPDTVDPFHDDSRLPAFLEWLKRRWS